MSLVGEEAESQSICVLRDYGTSQSLLLEGVLPLISESSYTKSNVLLQGAELGVSALLHPINLKTNMIPGPVMIGIRPFMLVQGVSLILGNNLHSRRDSYSHPMHTVSLNHQLNTGLEEIELLVPGGFPSCTIMYYGSQIESE